ncbi:MAG: hypothetical protein JSV65_19475 [Armatimonadota bacterium]|nr:MAG: hypothetical protein JSV65_19475 [Armatimonadota bacterium]
MRVRDPLKLVTRPRVPAVTVLVLALSVLTAYRIAAQAPRSTQPAVPMDVEPFQTVVIEANEVLRVADVVARGLARDGRIPTGAAVTLSDGRREPLSAARVFVLLARFLGNGYEDGMTPESAPLPPQTIGPLERTDQTSDVRQEQVISAADLLAQARPTADIAEGTGHLPSGVWIEGVRLTPAQFMGALATLLQHAAYTGEVPEQVAVAWCLPPLGWETAPAAPADRAPAPGTGSSSAASEGGDGAAPAQGVMPPETDTSSTAQDSEFESPVPQLFLYLSAEEKLSGEQVLTVEYQGPALFIRLTIDGVRKAVSNMSHFTYLWDTRLERDGKHTIEVTAVDQHGEELDRVEATVETANGNFPLR